MELHEFIDDGNDSGNCSVCHFFHTEPRGPKGERPETVAEGQPFHMEPVPVGETDDWGRTA
jgi:hypothetical protein